jgi:D-Tyr-tRNAtyr deacylase
MRAVVQRVLSASVEVILSSSTRHIYCILHETTGGADWSLRGSQVEGRVVSAIGPGVLVLVGVHESDTDSDADYMYELTSPSNL